MSTDPRGAGPGPDRRRRLPAMALALTVGVFLGAWLAWSPLGANDVVGGDEGYYGVMARNILADPARQLAGPSLSPLGPPGDKPPCYPSMLALSIAAFGPTATAIRWPSIAFALTIAIAVALLVARVAGPWSGTAAAAFLLALPWFADASRVTAAELPLTAFSALALVSAARGARTRHAVLAGALLGLAFLCKLWLVALVAVPVALALPLSTAGGRRALAALAASAAVVASLQLVAVAAFHPGDLAHWIGVYWTSSLAGRVGGAEFEPSWIQPPGYYWTLVTHAFGLLLPFVAVGAEEAWRRRREPLPRALLAWAAGVAVLSLFAVKRGGYAYVVVPGWAALAGFGAWGFARGSRPLGPFVAALLVGSAPWVTRALQGSPLPVALWAGVWGFYLLTAYATHGLPTLRRGLAIALSLAAIAGGFAREAVRMPKRYHDTGYRAVALTIAPALADVRPDRPCFVSPEVPALSYRLFRTGMYWSSEYIPWTVERRRAIEADSSLRFFVVDPRQGLYGSGLDSLALDWLERGTREITAEVEHVRGRSVPLRVFARE